MSLPSGVLSSTAVSSAVLAPDHRERADLSIDYELGGIALNDPSQGLQYQVWVGYVDKDTNVVYVKPEYGGVTTALFTEAGITELSITFDQNMDWTIAYVANGVTKLRWFDSSIPARVITAIPNATTPFLTLDDKRPAQLGASDMLLFYVWEGNLYYRQQRDRFATQYLLGVVPSYAQRIVSVGMGENLRMQVEIAGTLSAVYTDLSTDTMYGAAGVLAPLLTGTTEFGRWRSKVYVFDEQPSFAWVKVEGEYPVLVNVVANDVLLYTTPPILSNAPVRLPQGKFREWYIEIEADKVTTSVVLASTMAELKGAP